MSVKDTIRPALECWAPLWAPALFIVLMGVVVWWTN